MTTPSLPSPLFSRKPGTPVTRSDALRILANVYENWSIIRESLVKNNCHRPGERDDLWDMLRVLESRTWPTEGLIVRFEKRKDFYAEDQEKPHVVSSARARH